MNFIQRYRLRKKLNRIALAMEGTLRYVRSNDFGITGAHRGFPYYTRVVLNGNDEVEAFVVCLRLNNPNQKALRFAKSSFLDHYTREWGGQPGEHSLGQSVTMHTNDLFFSSSFLSDANLAHISHLLGLSGATAFWVHGTEMGLAIPMSELSSELAIDIREHLCEIKAGLG